MRARQIVLLAPSESSHPGPLLSRQHFIPVSPLAATLMDSPASVANKRLTARLNPLAAALTKNRGVGAPPFDVSTFGPSDLQTRCSHPERSSRFGTRSSIVLISRPSCSRIVRASIVLRMGDLGPATSRRDS